MASILTNPDRKVFTPSLIRRAKEKLHAFDKGEINAIYLKYAKQGDLYKIELGYRHRLVSHDRCDWVLLTHETYNHLFHFKR